MQIRIKSGISTTLQKLKIKMLKSEIRKMENSRYLNLCDRMTLRDICHYMQQLKDRSKGLA